MARKKTNVTVNSEQVKVEPISTAEQKTPTTPEPISTEEEIKPEPISTPEQKQFSTPEQNDAVEKKTGQKLQKPVVKRPSVIVVEKHKEPTHIKLGVLLNIRRGPSKTTPIITTKPAGTILPVKEILPSGWICTELDGEECFVLYDNGKYGTLIE